MCQWLVKADSSKLTGAVILREWCKDERYLKCSFWLIAVGQTGHDNHVSYLDACGAEQPKSTGNSHNVTVVPHFHLREEGFCHLLEEVWKIFVHCKIIFFNSPETTTTTKKITWCTGLHVNKWIWLRLHKQLIQPVIYHALTDETLETVELGCLVATWRASVSEAMSAFSGAGSIKTPKLTTGFNGARAPAGAPKTSQCSQVWNWTWIWGKKWTQVPLKPCTEIHFIVNSIQINFVCPQGAIQNT